MRLRFRTQLLLAMLSVSCALTAASLLLVRQSVRSEIRGQTQRGLAASVQAFQQVQREQASELARTAALVSELPTLKALMGTEDAVTIQDASKGFFTLSGADLLVLAGTDRQVKALHGPSAAVMTPATAQALLAAGADPAQPAWWHDGRQLYRVVFQPIVAGSGSQTRALGTLVIGRHMNDAVARQLAHLAGSEIALAVGNSVVAATLDAQARAAFERFAGLPVPGDLELAQRSFSAASVDLANARGAAIRCYVLVPLDAADALLARMNQTILLLGVLAVIGGTVLVAAISGAIMRPLEHLVGAVQAFARGDEQYSLDVRGPHDIAELAAAFGSMRRQVLESQQKQLEAERLAALGRAASSISHDLRHHLATLMANSEFLREADTLGFNRDEIYREIERASAQMTDLLDSLVEIARDRNTVIPSEGRLEDAAQRAADAVRSSPEFRSLDIEITARTATDGLFDGRKIERAIYNVLLNACEAAGARPGGRVSLALDAGEHTLECRIRDNGPGIPAEVRATLFEPFVSMGKNNGTGLGLAIASKIVHDHDGEIQVENTSPAGTTFLIRLPRRAFTPRPASPASSTA